jgi:hypothetical protein
VVLKLIAVEEVPIAGVDLPQLNSAAAAVAAASAVVRFLLSIE